MKTINPWIIIPPPPPPPPSPSRASHKDGPRLLPAQVLNADVKPRSYWGVVYGTSPIIQQLSIVAASVAVPMHLHQVHIHTHVWLYQTTPSSLPPLRSHALGSST